MNEEIRNLEVSVRGQLVVSYTKGVDESLLDLIANDHRHSQHLTQLACKRGFPGSLAAGHNNATWVRQSVTE